jgi:hypothetical protein
VIPEIENAESLTSIYGSRPAFHDAEILSVLLRCDPTATDLLASHHWNMWLE